MKASACRRANMLFLPKEAGLKWNFRTAEKRQWHLQKYHRPDVLFVACFNKMFQPLCCFSTTVGLMLFPTKL